MTKEAVQAAVLTAWSSDPSHAFVHFKVRHLAIAWVRGEFRLKSAKLELNAENFSDSRIEVEIDSASVNTGEAARDEHLRSADFLDVQHYPVLRFESTRMTRTSAETATVAGNLTICGVTRPVEVTIAEISPTNRDPWGNIRFAVSGSAKVNRKDFGLTWNNVLEAGGLMVGDEIFIDLDVEFTTPAK
jgi:polyisoprenoid-binding protein YceI